MIMVHTVIGAANNFESCESPLRNILTMIREMKSLIFFGVKNHKLTSFNMSLQLV